MPEFDVKQYGDYPDYVERTRVLLATINDHNLSVNKVNRAGASVAQKPLSKDTNKV